MISRRSILAQTGRQFYFGNGNSKRNFAAPTGNFSPEKELLRWDGVGFLARSVSGIFPIENPSLREDADKHSRKYLKTIHLLSKRHRCRVANAMPLLLAPEESDE